MFSGTLLQGLTIDHLTRLRRLSPVTDLSICLPILILTPTHDVMVQLQATPLSIHQPLTTLLHLRLFPRPQIKLIVPVEALRVLGVAPVYVGKKIIGRRLKLIPNNLSSTKLFYVCSLLPSFNLQPTDCHQPTHILTHGIHRHSAIGGD